MGTLICRQGGNIPPAQQGEVEVFSFDDSDNVETPFGMLEDYIARGIYVEILEYVPGDYANITEGVSQRMRMWDRLLGIGASEL